MEKEYVIYTFDTPTVNNRIYPRELFEKEIQKFIKEQKPIFGKIGMTYDKVLLQDLSHTISDIKIEDNNVLIKINILDNQNGQTLKKLLECNSVVFRTSGSGRLTSNNDGTYTVSDFNLWSINAVMNEDAI